MTQKEGIQTTCEARYYIWCRDIKLDQKNNKGNYKKGQKLQHCN